MSKSQFSQYHLQAIHTIVTKYLLSTLFVALAWQQGRSNACQNPAASVFSLAHSKLLLAAIRKLQTPGPLVGAEARPTKK